MIIQKLSKLFFRDTGDVNVSVNVTVDPALLKKTLEDIIVSVLSDKIAEVGKKVDDGFARQDVVIAELTTKVAEAPTPEDIAALEAIGAKADAKSPAPEPAPPAA